MTTNKKQSKNIKFTTRIIQKQVDLEDKQFTALSSQETVKFLQKQIGDVSNEIFVILALDTKNNVVAYYEAFSGSIDSTIADPKVIMQFALLNNARSIIVSHNHPSGCVMPSELDKKFTKRLSKCCKLMDICFLDHIVVSETNSYSFAEMSEI